MALIAGVILFIVKLVTGAHHLTVILGDEEWFGHRCYHHDLEIEVDGEWRESPAVECDMVLHKK